MTRITDKERELIHGFIMMHARALSLADFGLDLCACIDDYIDDREKVDHLLLDIQKLVQRVRAEL